MLYKDTLESLILERIESHQVPYTEEMRQTLFDKIKEDAKNLEIDDVDDRFTNLAANILTYMLDFGGESALENTHSHYTWGASKKRYYRCEVVEKK